SSPTPKASSAHPDTGCANPALIAASPRVWGLRSEGLRSEQAEAPSGRDRLGQGVYAQLSEQAPQMVAHRLGRESQLLGDLGRRPARGDQLEDLALTGSQSRLRLTADAPGPRVARSEGQHENADDRTAGAE